MARPRFDVVLVGYRPGALHAASRMGLRVLLVDERPPSKAAKRRIVAAARLPLEDAPEALVAGVREALGPVRPRAVVSAGERGVLGAAAVRAAYGLAGVDPETARRARDKPAMKDAARAAGVRCTDWHVLAPSDRADDLVQALGLPVVVKRRAGAGSRDLRVATTSAEVEARLGTIAPDDRAGWMAERFVQGVEMSVESFVTDGEVRFTNPTEYFVPAFANIAPAVLSPEVLDEVLDLNRRALKALGIQRGMTHLELYRTDEGAYFGEVAVRPPGGRIMRLLRRAYHFDPWEAVWRTELEDAPPPLPRRADRAAGVWMFHPGPGRVASVKGLVAARRVEGVRKLVCHVRAGSVVEPRESTGSDVGWIEVWGRTRDEVAERLERAHALVRIELEPPGVSGATETSGART